MAQYRTDLVCTILCYTDMDCYVIYHNMDLPDSGLCLYIIDYATLQIWNGVAWATIEDKHHVIFWALESPLL
jgi:hypothetical protein